MVEIFPLIKSSKGVYNGFLVGQHPEWKYEVGKERRAFFTLDLVHNDVSKPISHHLWMDPDTLWPLFKTTQGIIGSTSSSISLRYLKPLNFSKPYLRTHLKIISKHSYQIMEESTSKDNSSSCVPQQVFKCNTYSHTHHNKMVNLRGRRL